MSGTLRPPVQSYQRIEFWDVRMTDGGAHRRYSDGREEWRWPRGPVLVDWRANDGTSGTDEQLARRYLKRTVRRDGGDEVRWGRDIGYGRTVWSDWTMTQNRTSFEGRLGALLAVAAVVTLAPTVPPPGPFPPEVEEELRREQARRTAGDGSGSSGGGSSADGGSGSSGGSGERDGDDAWDDGSLDSDDFG